MLLERVTAILWLWNVNRILIRFLRQIWNAKLCSCAVVDWLQGGWGGDSG